MQTTNTVLMIRPTRFSFNQDTAANNRFQRPAAVAEDVQLKALAEFDGYVDALRRHGVEVLVHNDREAPHTPDSIFPNNWWSTHPDGTLVLYPMQGHNRRLERDKGVLDGLLGQYRVEQVLDLSSLEAQEIFLEGTGSMVLDRQQRICYAGYSTRTHAQALDRLVSHLGYELCGFNAVDRQGVAIYHTNVMMSVGSRVAVACLASVAHTGERAALRERLETSGKQLIDLNWAQLESFAGNMLEVHSAAGEPLLVMSRTAWQSLDADQRRMIETHTTPLPVNIDTIERIGGGSARCMLAEVFLPRYSSSQAAARTPAPFPSAGTSCREILEVSGKAKPPASASNATAIR